MRTLASLVDAIADAMDEVSSLFDDPSTLTFDSTRAEIERLEKAFNHKGTIDASFAYLCEPDGAGRSVGATYANDYLEKALDLSRAEALRRLQRGRDLFAPPAAHSEPDPALDFDTPPRREKSGDSGAQQKKARDDARGIGPEKQAVIDNELRALSKEAAHQRASILARALGEAAGRSVSDLRKFVRTLVDRANLANKPATDPNAGFSSRCIRASRRKSDGTYDVTATMTAGDWALFKALLDSDSAPGSNISADSKQDYRTPAQRRYDQFWRIITQFESDRQVKNRGAASVVLAITLDDLADADWHTTFMTNTGVEVDCFDLVRLGMGGTKDFILHIDRVTGEPIALGSTRLASVEQRIAMLAVQGVCAWTGCDVPMSETEMHHILAYIHGGKTDLLNLAGLCRRHHSWNNDYRDGRNGKSHVAKCPDTQRIAVVSPDGTVSYNDTVSYHQSPGAKLRKREHKIESRQAPDPPMFHPPHRRKRRPA
ncbi:HNH endonuclease signature motif containing protein [Corynebacterium lipophiloflavum]|uniref:HNH endonuclease domain protein n=1 Tax=Corynebacterium lipophiloflavum (strain ATCC 700352 / DSM 44291 / CCUG 37336 / JCM 10383 / DMMZ 1944) TaxID=525263 RepID=C0XP98_CORLD|nr:HNH endonuclease signature motif containing protein [Corynebacterium lipophiloflavum]EEI17929.1 HNH endonuclease domain protein [Corynebacterium lipophiloflavum DSM 44291]